MGNNGFIESVDNIVRTTPVGSIRKALTNTLYGINHRQVTSAAKRSEDRQGLTFITRPQLNLSTDNIRNVRQLYHLLSEDEYSIQRYVRCTLDPRLQYGDKYSLPLSCPLVDPHQAFIPLVTNTLVSVTGWPDPVVPVFTSKEGLYKEQYAQVDGSHKIYNSFDIDLTFRNIYGNPLIMLFYTWLLYMSSVFEGTMVPYPDFIVENEIDYNTRIYRLVMDTSNRYVTMLAATGVSFPKNDPLGQFFDYSDEKPYLDQTSQFSIRFHSLGAQYMDDILVKEFNETVKIFNPTMSDVTREGSMVKIPYDLLLYFNHRGYPRINEETYELEWWVHGNAFDNAADGIKRLVGLINEEESIANHISSLI